MKSKFGKLRMHGGYYYVGNKPFHRLLFESVYGSIPDGYIVHHKNGNRLDNCILNLQLMRTNDHNKLHHRNRSDETCRNISEAKLGEKNGMWKNYARIIKAGFANGKQMYTVKRQGKQVKYSMYPSKLLDWFNENYPNEMIVLSSGDLDVQ